MGEPADPTVNLDEWRAKLDELAGRWRGDAVRVRERAGVSIEKIAKDLGLVTRREYDELELRIAQLEHRLSLLERDG
jgi:polyhydroxyalkanoate synthesis regulator phasin